jgi:glyoxylase-like metal-dependent hydrolase (beta-lactamase superfamily II)
MAPYFRYPTCLRFLGEWISKGGARPHPIGEVTRFDDGEDLPVPGRLRAIHTPGHTEGHAAFVSGDVLITGDALCTLNPLTGERGPQVLPAAVSASVDESLASLDKLVGTGASLLLPATAIRSASRTAPSPTRSAAAPPRAEVPEAETGGAAEPSVSTSVL